MQVPVAPPLRIGFIGAGQMAGQHLDALRRVATPHVVAGVCDLRLDAAHALARRAGASAYPTVAELLTDARPDVVHICTQPATHFDLARQALLAGAHVYVEKPFVETRGDAEALFALGRDRGLLLCAGHQLVRDPAFRRLLERATTLQPPVLVDSYFAFRPPRLHPYRSAPAALGEQLLDVLPHPLYTLVAALTHFLPNTGIGGAAPQRVHATAAVTSGSRSPLSIEHLRRVTDIYEELAVQVPSRSRPAVRDRAASSPPSPAGGPGAPVALVTGAAGFLGRALTRELTRRGFRVRATYRSQPSDDPHVHEWVRVDLRAQVPYEVFAGASVVLHAAAATSGGFEAHQRDSVDATRQVLRGMTAAGVRRLVYVSSISVLRPPRSARERQTEETPLAAHAERLGPYTWGKCAAEELVTAAHARQDVVARIVRPAALIDWEDIDVPGLVGRRLFERWHLGFGRPGLPFAVCEVGRAAAAVAWCARHFADAVSVMRFVAALARRERARPLAVWSILRPRRYDATVAAKLLTAAGEAAAPTVSAPRAAAPAAMTQAYG